MKIKFGALVTEGRGKIGGHIASRNRAGAYLRTKISPVNRNTVLQQTNRSSFGAIARAWRFLTQAQRDAWNAAVSNWQTTDIFGDVKTPSGFNLHQRLNSLRALFDLEYLVTPPSPLANMQPAMFRDATIVLSTGAIEVDVQTPDPINVGTENGFIIRATPPLSPGQEYVRNKTRIIGTFSGNDLPAVNEDDEFMPMDITEMYTDTFGALSLADEGSKIYISATLVHLPSGSYETGSGKYFVLES